MENYTVTVSTPCDGTRTYILEATDEADARGVIELMLEKDRDRACEVVEVKRGGVSPCHAAPHPAMPSLAPPSLAQPRRDFPATPSRA